MEDKKQRMKELIDILNDASVHYYQYSESIMTDYEYDKLYDELVSLEQETNTILSNSPTINVESSVSSKLEKYTHPEPMLSLSKTKKIEDLEDFIDDKKGILSWKLDGLTIVLTYNHGKLIRGVTRGNGIIGEVVTNNVKQFKNIPHEIDYQGELILRGEAIIKYSDFIKMNGDIEEDLQYKNPRNLCSGSVRQLDSKITKERNVNIIIFALIKCDINFSSKMDQYAWLDSLGFETVQRVVVDKKNIRNEVLNYKEKIKNYDIPSDGLVLTYDDILYSMSLGTTAKYPKHSLAFKWKDDAVETKLIDVIFNTSRTGLINPIALFEPVEIEGTVVSRASVHNISIMKGLKLGKGDIITVFKANMIIPQIASNLTESNNIEIPSFCPVCNGKTELISNNDVQYLYCTNEFCHAKFIKKLSLFTSRNAMNIDGISDSILSKLFYEGLLNEYSDLYHLDKYKELIINYEGFGIKSYNNMINSIEKSRNVKLANFIYALGIKDIGLSRAKLICKYCNNDINKVLDITFDELSNIDGVGQIIASSFLDTINNEKFRKSLDNILKEVNFINDNDVNNNLENMIFVITGSLNHFENRDSLIETIEKYGGKVISNVSNNVNYLINNDITSNSSKNKKAKELGIPIIKEDELLNMIK